ncbi:MAG: hypothetical protein RQM92_16595 [Candidatus Syntrophopropionicum ammoniitolerans]
MMVKELHEAGAAQMIIVNISYPFFSYEMTKTPLLYFKVWSPGLSVIEKEELKVPLVLLPPRGQKLLSSRGRRIAKTPGITWKKQLAVTGLYTVLGRK